MYVQRFECLRDTIFRPPRRNHRDLLSTPTRVTTTCAQRTPPHTVQGTYILPNTCSLTSKHLTLPASKSFESAFRARSSIWYPYEFKFANNHGYAIEYLMGIYETVGYCP